MEGQLSTGPTQSSFLYCLNNDFNRSFSERLSDISEGRCVFFVRRVTTGNRFVEKLYFYILTIVLNLNPPV